MSFKGFNEDFSLEGKNALVTGAASGIGLEICKMFARKGANIIAFDLDESAALKEYVEKAGRKYIGYSGNVTQKNVVDEAVTDAIEKFGRIDILVNCAGIGIIDNAEDLKEDIWDKTLNVNLKGPFLMSQAVARTMIKNGGGKIVNMASQAGVVALDKHIAYGASKAALINVTKVCALEWAKYNIRVNAISPTVVLTPLGERVWDNPQGDAFKKLVPAGRFAYPQEVAACAVFLSSDAADMINGENLVIDGGYTIA
jgi:NAD(P)-dependent dehydrogenase (short-subunit alcohol dehydrogenase family)